MSQTKYCPKCGKPSAYANGVAPRFCAACGIEFAAAFKVAVQPPAPAVKKPKKKYIEVEADDDEVDEDGEFYGEIIVPRKFECDIIIPKRISIGDVRRGQNIQGGVNPNLGPSDIK